MPKATKPTPGVTWSPPTEIEGPEVDRILATVQNSVAGNLELLEKLGVPEHGRVDAVLTLLAWMEFEYAEMEQLAARTERLLVTLRGFNATVGTDPGIALAVADHERAAPLAQSTIRNAIKADRSVRGKRNAQGKTLNSQQKRVKAFAWLEVNGGSIVRQSKRLATFLDIPEASAKNLVIDWRKFKRARG